MRIDRFARAGLMAALFFVATDFGARAQSAPPAPNAGAQAAADVFHEAESKYMFGFIDGSDIGNEGEKAFEYEATGSFQKRGGHYTAIEHEFEFEHVLTQNFAYELSAHALTHSISGVEDLDDRNSTQFSGASAKLRYLILGRGPGSPIGLTISAEPEWSRVDGTDGTAAQAYASAFMIVADTELIANRLYAAINLTYEPEVAKPADTGMWERSSSAAVGLGLTYRLTPTLAMGVAAEYDRAYDGLAVPDLPGARAVCRADLADQPQPQDAAGRRVHGAGRRPRGRRSATAGSHEFRAVSRQSETRDRILVSGAGVKG